MDYEKKYKEALERAKKMIKAMTNIGSVAKVDDIQYLFPELKESEDEKIRKALIEYYSFDKDGGSHALDNITPKQIVAWLEKQSIDISSFPEEQQVFMQKYIDLDKITLIKLLAERDANNAEIIESFEKQGEQKPVEPQQDMLSQEKYAKAVDECVYGEQNPTNRVKPKFKVKYAGSEYNVFEVKYIAGVTYYGIEDEPNHIDYVLPDNCKIVSEQVPVWSEEDEKRLRSCLNVLQARGIMGVTETVNTKWLKSLKDRVQPKQEWSDEDEEIRSALIKYLGSSDALSVDLASAIYWLKSLRPKSNQEVDEQIETIAMHLDNCGDTAMAEILRSCNLRPQNTWKPSDEQIKVLDEILIFAANHESPHWNDYIFGTLNNLIRQLIIL